MALKLIGYWNSRNTDLFVDPTNLVDPSFYACHDKEHVVAFLRTGHEHGAYLGYSTCRFPNGPPDSEMGCRELTDGIWIWPEGLAVYVERYDVRLPQEFVDDIAKVEPGTLRRGRPNDLQRRKISSLYWRKWCRRISSASWANDFTGRSRVEE